jgi:hypothetical protein
MRYIGAFFGSHRFTRKFLIFPTTLRNDEDRMETRWLEWAYIAQTRTHSGWIDVRWA